MKPKINLSEPLVLHAVWELEDSYWEILSIVRLKSAIALTRESPLNRLVFPTEVKPNGVWGGVCKKHTPKTNCKKADSLQKRQERVLTWLEQSPGQTREVIASLLEISIPTALQLLRKLEKENEIHYLPHPSQHKTRLYYVGASPTTRGTSANKSTCKPVLRLRKEPPLKIYFVDSRTLQPLN